MQNPYGNLNDHDIPKLISKCLLAQCVESVDVRGTERVPAKGPLFVASNHLGAYDGVAIIANPGRDDFKIVISDVLLTRSLPVTSKHLIYVAPNPHRRMEAVRSMMHHLRAGGALLIFPSGLVDPDPDLQPGSEQALETWSPSLDLILHRVPETRLVVSIVSGVLAESCLRNPLTRLTKEGWKKRKLAEFLQISQQLLFSKKFGLNVRVYFWSAGNSRRSEGWGCFTKSFTRMVPPLSVAGEFAAEIAEFAEVF